MALINTNRSLIGYVPQDDVMNPLLTVKENIMHSAMMRLPNNEDFPNHQKERLVSVVIQALGLSAKQDVIVGDLGNYYVINESKHRTHLLLLIFRRT